jgi:PKD-like domain
MKLYRSFFLFAVAVLLGLSACEKNFPDGGEFEEPTFLKIVGGNQHPKNSTRDYYTYYLENGDYVWTAPADAQILSPQGKSKITIKFGTQSGTVSVKAKGMENSVQVTIK